MEPREKATPVCCPDLRGVRSVVQEPQTAPTCRLTPYPPAPGLLGSLTF